MRNHGSGRRKCPWGTQFQADKNKLPLFPDRMNSCTSCFQSEHSGGCWTQKPSPMSIIKMSGNKINKCYLHFQFPKKTTEGSALGETDVLPLSLQLPTLQYPQISKHSCDVRPGDTTKQGRVWGSVSHPWPVTSANHRGQIFLVFASFFSSCSCSRSQFSSPGIPHLCTSCSFQIWLILIPLAGRDRQNKPKRLISFRMGLIS